MKTLKLTLLRLFFVISGIFAGIVILEFILAGLDLPRCFYVPSRPIQFTLKLNGGKYPFYTNKPSTNIIFCYDGSYRDYFKRSSEVCCRINSSGFRGDEFIIEKPVDTIRLCFFGDSFTFGEGVRFEDTYPEVTVRILESKFRNSKLNFQSYNFGVGGYNTVQEVNLIKTYGLVCKPDMVIIGYALNDPEEPLFIYDKDSNQIFRRKVEMEYYQKEIFDLLKSHKYLRVIEIIRRFWKIRSVNKRIINYYKSLYREDFHGWSMVKDAFIELGKICNENDIPWYCLCFPVLINLKNYPFLDIHNEVRKMVENAGGRWIDLLPELKMYREKELYVHPLDQHPNEIVHRIAGQCLAERILKDGVIRYRE